MSTPSTLEGRTAAHYDAYPFEFLTPADENAIRDLQPAPFLRFVDQYVQPGARVAEIGCGPGRATLFLARRNINVAAVDISFQSLQLARGRAGSANFVLSSNLALPFPSCCFDIVISDGVIHHTPDPHASFCENARITKVGGFYYLGVYNRRRYYYYMYTFIGRPIRWLERSWLGRALIFATILPLYWGIHLVKWRGQRTWNGAVNFFYDYFITPQATFHSYEEIQNWAAETGMDVIEYDPSLGNVHVFVLKKRRNV